MAKFKFEIPAPLDSANSFTKIKGFLNGDNEFKKYDANMTCTFDESSKLCRVDSSQIKATLQVFDKDSKSSQIAIEVEVPLALSLFKGKIQEILEKNISKILS